MKKEKLSDFEKRISDYYLWSNPSVGKSWRKGRKNTRRAEKHITHAIEKKDFKLFKTFGSGPLGQGYNASEYHNKASKMLETHIDWQLEKYVELTGGKIEDLIFPNIGSIVGYHDDSLSKDVVIPYTAPRLGYYLNTSFNFYKDKHPEERKIDVLEVGGGWGALCYLARKNREDVGIYTIVDIPTTIVVAAYFLNEAGLSVLLPNEVKKFSKEELSKVDCVFLETQQLDSVKPNFFNLSISTACMPELSKVLIGRYLREMSRLSEVAYIDSTQEGRGPILRNYLLKKQSHRIWEPACDLEVEMKKTPITAYYPKWYVHCPVNEADKIFEYYITFFKEKKK